MTVSGAATPGAWHLYVIAEFRGYVEVFTSFKH